MNVKHCILLFLLLMEICILSIDCNKVYIWKINTSQHISLGVIMSIKRFYRMFVTWIDQDLVESKGGEGGVVVMFSVVSQSLHCCSLSQASIFCYSCCWPNTQSHFYTSYRQKNRHSICWVSGKTSDSHVDIFPNRLKSIDNQVYFQSKLISKLLSNLESRQM